MCIDIYIYIYIYIYYCLSANGLTKPAHHELSFAHVPVTQRASRAHDV